MISFIRVPENVRYSFAWTTLVLVVISGLTGCAEGPLWRTGYLSPWIKRQWADEEKIAQSLYSKQNELLQIVDQAASGDESAKLRASQQLAEIAEHDEILLLRIKAVELLGNFSNETADQTLRVATVDRDSDVRGAAVRALGMRTDVDSLDMLAGVVERESNVDVKLLAVAALGKFKDLRAAQAIAPLLADADPAVQFRVAQSLGSVTGQGFGADIQAWQRYVENQFGTTGNVKTAASAGPLPK